MTNTDQRDHRDFTQLAHEHALLLREFGRVQARCDAQLTAQRARIEHLEGEAMRLRGQLIARDTALALLREDQAALQAALPDLPKRQVLARRVDTLVERVRNLMRERLVAKAVLCIGQDASNAAIAQRVVERAGGHFLRHDGRDADDSAALEASLRAADMVICQTGCVSHGAYWRVQDHCRRTGKTCVLVERPLRFVRHIEQVGSA